MKRKAFTLTELLVVNARRLSGFVLDAEGYEGQAMNVLVAVVVPVVVTANRRACHPVVAVRIFNE